MEVEERARPVLEVARLAFGQPVDRSQSGEQPLDVPRAEPRDRSWFEPRERLPERGPLAQDRQPREAGLEPLEAELLVDAHVVVDGPPPLVVVVGDVLGRRRRPSTSLASVSGPD